MNNNSLPLMYIATMVMNGLINLSNQWHQRKEGEKNREFQNASQILSFLNQQKLAQENHFYRLNEVYFSAKFQEQLQKIIYKYNKEIEEIRCQNTIRSQQQIAWFNWQLKQLEQFEKNHPFVKPSEVSIEILKQSQKNSGGLPLILIPPDDTLTEQAKYIGFQETKWLRAIVKDGYFERPLRQKDRDLDIIYFCLSDIPAMVINVLFEQQKGVYLQITHWGILPGSNGFYTKDLVGPYSVPSIKQGNQSDELFKIQNQVVQDAVVCTAVLADIYHLTQPNHIRPCLKRYGVTDIEKLKFWGQTFSLYYEVICEEEPQNEPLLRLDEAQMLYEVNCTQEASQAIENSVASWYRQKVIDKNKELDIASGLTNVIYQVADVSDITFLNNLAKAYQVTGQQSKASEIFRLAVTIESTKKLLKSESTGYVLPTSSSLIKRLEAESEALSKMGFDISIIAKDQGYVLTVSNENDLHFSFWIPPDYPTQSPEVFMKTGNLIEPITFEEGVWRNDCSLEDILSAIISS